MGIKYEETEPRFTSYPEVKIYLGSQHDLHVVCDSEHHTCYFSDEITVTRLENMCITLKAAIGRGDWDLLMQGFAIFSEMDKKACVMGDMKQGSVYMDAEDEPKDRWRDGLKWEVWTAPEYIANEFYSKEQRKKARR